jgi:predicted DNA-binding transcriptional regulator AlpA
MVSESADAQPLLLPPPAVQQLLGCSRTTLRKLEGDGALIPVRNGKSIRYIAVEVQAYVDRLMAERDQKRGQGRPRSGTR